MYRAMLTWGFFLCAVTPAVAQFPIERVTSADLAAAARKHQSDVAATQPAATQPTISAAAYTDRDAESLRQGLLKERLAAAKEAARTHDRPGIEQATRGVRLLRQLSRDELKAWLARRDTANQHEVERVRAKYADVGRVAAAACRWLERNGAVRRATPRAAAMDANAAGPFPVDVDFEFVTKAGLVRHNRGWIRFERRGLPFPVPVGANVDGVPEGQTHPIVSPNPSDDVSLGTFNEQFGGRLTQFGIGVGQDGLVLTEAKCFVDDW